MSHKRPPLTPAERAHAVDIRDRLAKQVCAPLDPQTGTCWKCEKPYQYIQYKTGFCRTCRKVTRLAMAYLATGKTEATK